MTNRRLALYCVAGAMAYVATLVVTLPASWIARALERGSSQKLILRAPAGSLWAGSGRLYARSRSGSMLELGELRWRTSWRGLYAGTLATDVAFGDAARAAHVELSFSGVTLQNMDVRLPARILASLAPELETVGPQGELRLRSESLRLEAGSILGLAEIEWRGMRMSRAPSVDLGSHVARLRGGGGRVDIELATLEGPLRVTGGGTWAHDAGLAVAGSAEHGAQANPELATFLGAVCTSYRDNRCGFRFKG